MFNQNILKKLTKYCLWALLFFLPWQTRWLYEVKELNGGFWEYGSAALYGTEILLWLTIFFFSAAYFFNRNFWQRLVLKNKGPNLKFILVSVWAGILLAVLLKSSLDFNISYDWFFHLLEAWCLAVIIFLLLKWEENDFGLSLYLSLWFGGIAQALLAIIQFFTQSVVGNKWLGMATHLAAQGGASVIEFSNGRFLRAYGSFGWPNSLGIYLAIVWLVGFLIYLKLFANTTPKIKKLKILVFIGELIILLGLFLSFSRAAWIAAAVGLVIFLIIEFFKERADFKKVINLVFVNLGFAIILVLIFKPLLFARLDFNNRLENRSLSERSEQFLDSQEFIKDNFWLGVGAGNYTTALFKKYPNLNAWDYQPAHNIYLLSLVELGVLAAALYWALVFWIFKYVSKNNPESLGIITALLIFGLFDHWLFSLYTGVLFFWLILAVFLNKKTG